LVKNLPVSAGGAREVDEPRAYHTEGRESERERRLWYIDTYIWNLERWC